MAMEWRHFASFLVTCFVTAPLISGEGVFDFSCDADQTGLTFTYINEPGTPATFIYAEGKRQECSLTSTDPEITGNGTSVRPYTLTIRPRDNPAHVTACGVQESNSVYSFSIEVKFAAQHFINNNNDKTYTISCDFSSTTTEASSSTVLAQYACDGTKTLHFNYLNTISAPVDIFADGKRDRCGMANGDGTGTGTGSDRYELAIDLSGSSQSPDCGAQELAPDVYTVNIIVQSTDLILRADDMVYRLTCNFSQPFSELSSADGVTVDQQLTNASAANLIGQARLRVLDENSNPITQIGLGQQIKLEVSLVGSDAEGVRVTACEARPSVASSAKITLLNANGCSSGDLIQPFTSTDGHAASTPLFPAFRFVDTATLVYVCLVDFCYDRAKSGCIGTHCTSGVRKKRSSKQAQERVSALVVILDSSRFNNLSASTTQPEVTCACNGSLFWGVIGILAFLILLLFLASCLVLLHCLKLRRRADQKKA